MWYWKIKEYPPQPLSSRSHYQTKPRLFGISVQYNQLSFVNSDSVKQKPSDIPNLKAIASTESLNDTLGWQKPNLD